MKLWPWTKRKRVEAVGQLMLVRARFDAAQTTPDNRKHWSNADPLSADAAASPEVRRTLRNRARYEVANNSYARGIVLTLANALIGFINVIVVTVVGVFWFEVPIRGGLALLFASTALYLMTALGVGLLISTISQTQQQAMMSTFFFYFPAILLSGFMFPIANMPEPIQWLTYVNPLRHFLIIVRGIFLKGVGADVLWPQMFALLVLGCLTLWLAGLRFRKTLA